MSIVLNEQRIGNFTSSQMHKLMSLDRSKKNPGKPFYTYVEEKKFESLLGRSLDTDAYSRSMAWGEFMEKRVFELIGLEYIIVSDQTARHPQILGWTGSTDLIVPAIKISEIKGYQLKNFCAYQEALKSEDLDRIKRDFPQEYWQMVSNAVIHDTPKAEAILYAPYESEMPTIRGMAEDYDEADQWKYKFIYDASNYELPVLPNDCGYDNLTVFEFDVPKEDKEALTNRVLMAIEERDKALEITEDDLKGVL